MDSVPEPSEKPPRTWHFARRPVTVTVAFVLGGFFTVVANRWLFEPLLALIESRSERAFSGLRDTLYERAAILSATTSPPYWWAGLALLVAWAFAYFFATAPAARDYDRMLAQLQADNTRLLSDQDTIAKQLDAARDVPPSLVRRAEELRKHLEVTKRGLRRGRVLFRLFKVLRYGALVGTYIAALGATQYQEHANRIARTFHVATARCGPCLSESNERELTAAFASMKGRVDYDAVFTRLRKTVEAAGCSCRIVDIDEWMK